MRKRSEMRRGGAVSGDRSVIKIQDRTAQRIAERTCEVLGYSVLVTDENGIIIGCVERNRLGLFHKPSIAAMRGGIPVLTSPEQAKRDEVRPGYTAPITFSSSVVGSIAMSGLPKDVKRYGDFVQRQAEILMMEEAFSEVRMRRQKALRELAEGIMLYHPDDSNAAVLLFQGRELGFDLENCHIAVIVEFSKPDNVRPEDADSFAEMTLNRIVNFLDNHLHLVAPLVENQIAMFLTLPCSRYTGEMEEAAAALCRSLAEHMRESGIDIRVGIGYEADNLKSLARSAHIARDAMSVGKALGMSICPANKLNTEILLSYLPRGRRQQHIDGVLRNIDMISDELMDTFMTWCGNPFAMCDVARELSIHRNTLKYRLERLRDILGLDTLNFHDCFAIWAAFTLRKLERQENQHSAVTHGKIKAER